MFFGNCVLSATVIVLSNDVGEFCIQEKKKNLFRTVHYLFSKMYDLNRTGKKPARSQETNSKENKNGAKTNGRIYVMRLLSVVWIAR